MNMKEMEHGKQIAESILKESGNMPISQVSNDRWMDRKRTELIRTIAKKGGLSQTDIAQYLGITREALYLKNSNNRFSIDDLMAVLYACDYWMTIQSQNDDYVYRVYPVDYFTNYDDERLKHLAEVKRKHPADIEEKRKEYEALKEQLKKFKESYGFED